MRYDAGMKTTMEAVAMLSGVVKGLIMNCRAAQWKHMVIVSLTLLAVSASATDTHGRWIIIDNQDTADSDGVFAQTLSNLDSANAANYNGRHIYFRRTHNADPIIYTGTLAGAVPDGTKWLVLDSRSGQFAWGKLGQSLGSVSEGVVYDWSIKVGDRNDSVPLPGDYAFGLFVFEDGDLQEISVRAKTDVAPVDGVLVTNVTWDSSGSGLDGKPLYFVMELNAGSATTARQLLCDSVSVTTSGVELVSNGGFESDLASWEEIPSSCTWTFKNLPAGDYEVAASWLEAANRDATVPFVVNGATNYVDQQQAPEQLLLNDGDSWVAFDMLGTTTVNDGQLQVSLVPDDVTDYTIADAVAIRRVSWSDAGFCTNGSFELPAVAAGSYAPWDTPVPGWISVDGKLPLIVSETLVSGMPAAPDGAQWGILDTRSAYNGGCTIVQCLDTVEEGKNYRWRITLGNRPDYDYPAPTEFGLYTVSSGAFVARSVKVAADVTMTQKSGATQSFDVLWDSAGSGADGEQLYFMMSMPDSGLTLNQLLIDDISVARIVVGTIFVIR